MVQFRFNLNHIRVHQVVIFLPTHAGHGHTAGVWDGGHGIGHVTCPRDGKIDRSDAQADSIGHGHYSILKCVRKERHAIRAMENRIRSDVRNFVGKNIFNFYNSREEIEVKISSRVCARATFLVRTENLEL